MFLSSLLSVLLLGAPPEAEWRSVIGVQRTGDAGRCSLHVNDFLLRQAGEPRSFRFRALWRYDAEAGRWKQVIALPEGEPMVLRPGDGTAIAGTLLVKLPEEIGLYWAVWHEGERTTGELAFSGPVLCNDVEIGEPPAVMIATCVPSAESATAMFVPDPRIQCRE